MAVFLKHPEFQVYFQSEFDKKCNEKLANIFSESCNKKVYFKPKFYGLTYLITPSVIWILAFRKLPHVKNCNAVDSWANKQFK